MSRKKPYDLIEKQHDGPIPLGTYKLRGDNDELITTYPKKALRLNNLDSGDQMRIFVDQRTGAIVTIPKE